MSEPSAPTQRSKLEFFGTITASLSHELKNVLATINEFSGLLTDLVQLSERGQPLKTDRLVHLAQKITAHVQRGEQLIRRLNRFAHSTDEPVQQVPLGEVLENLFALTLRFATLNRVTLEQHFPEGELHLRVDPFALQQAVFFGLIIAMKSGGSQRKVDLRYALAGGRCTVEILSGDRIMRGGGLEAPWRTLEQVMGELGGRIGLCDEPDENGYYRLSLELPLT